MRTMSNWSKSKTTLVLFLILAIAVFFRFYKITATPPGLYPDEAANGVNALTANRDHHWKLYYPENNGREGLFINIQSLSLKIFGAQLWALRIVSGIFGVLTVLGLFFLTRLLWGNATALVTSYLVAVSFWPVNFSRIGFRAVMLSFILVWAFYFLWLGLLKKRKWLVFLAGLTYGIGFHTYISWRLSPLLIILIFLTLMLVKHPMFNRKFILKSLVVFGLGAFITMSPLLIYYFGHPSDFMGRAAQVSIFNSPSPVQALGESAIKTLGMFNFYGDGNWRHNLAGRPELFWPLGLGFLIGLWVTVKNIRSPNYKLLIANYFLFFWLLVMLLPNFLAPEGAPHALRALGAMPAVFILAAVGLVWLYRRFFSKLKKAGLWAFLFLLFVGVWEAKTYFVAWAQRPEVASNFDQRLADIGRYLQTADSQTKFVVVNENGSLIKNIPIQAQPIIFLNFNNDSVKYLRPEDLDKLPSNLADAKIILTRDEPVVADAIAQKYPQAELIKEKTFRYFKIK